MGYNGVDPRSAKQVSVGGADWSAWSRDGRQLFFVKDDTMMVADINAGPPLTVGRVQRSFTATNFYPAFNVAPDGRFLRILSTVRPDAGTRIEVVLNFQDVLRRAGAN